MRKRVGIRGDESDQAEKQVAFIASDTSLHSHGKLPHSIFLLQAGKTYYQEDPQTGIMRTGFISHTIEKSLLVRPRWTLADK